MDTAEAMVPGSCANWSSCLSARWNRWTRIPPIETSKRTAAMICVAAGLEAKMSISSDDSNIKLQHTSSVAASR